NLSPFLRSDYPAEAIVESTRAAVDAAKTLDVANFVHVSYAWLYGDTGDTLAEETAPLGDAQDPYFKAGKAAEAIVRGSGLRYCIVRAGYAYGVLSPAMRTVNAALRAGRPVHTGPGHNDAPWVYDEDLANAIVLATLLHTPEAVYNVVDDEPATPRAFVDYLSTAQGMQPQGAVAALLKLFSRAQTSALLSLSTRVSNARAKSVLGWEPRFKHYRAGIDEILLLWRAEGIPQHEPEAVDEAEARMLPEGPDAQS
ncbi:MAG: NAD-dependent epimerase/dehydratase family protein, partial [Chloroflexota bacterium]